MTTLLEQALSRVTMLPASEEAAVAAIVIEELAPEQRWAYLLGSCIMEIRR